MDVEWLELLKIDLDHVFGDKWDCCEDIVFDRISRCRVGNRLHAAPTRFSFLKLNSKEILVMEMV